MRSIFVWIIILSASMAVAHAAQAQEHSLRAQRLQDVVEDQAVPRLVHREGSVYFGYRQALHALQK